MEWQIVTVIIALVSLIAAIAGPLVKLNNTITKLSTIIDHAIDRLKKLEQDDEEMQASSKEAHKRIHARIDDQAKTLQDHEIRINNLERK